MANVTAQEQLMLELINRARLNPVAEAARFGIDLNANLPVGTISTAPKAVLAMNDQLVASSRAHSTWMLQADVFDHTGSGGSSAGDRMTAAGYAFTGSWTWGENISWSGVLPGPIDLSTAVVSQHRGLFLSAGHRTNILGEGFREIGIAQERGNFLANGTDWSASMITQNFARSGANVFLTGVAYTDGTNDDFYGIGEGVGAVTISRSGGGATTTGAAGGYELAFTGAGAQTITMGAATVGLTLSAANAKLDLVNGNEIWTNATVTSLAGAAGAFLLGIADINATGGAAGETLTGNSGANRLLGLAGADRLVGLAGNDTMIADGPVSLTAAAGQIKRLYIATLDRAPDEAGWQGWATAREGGQTLDSIAAGFVNSTEFQTKYGALDNAQFVTQLYRNVLDREPDAGGFAAYKAALDSGQLSRTAMVTGFSESGEFINGTSPGLHAGQIYRLYGATLGRAPDGGGFEGWTDILGGGRGLVDIAGGFVGSNEFQTTYGALDNEGFVTLLYQNVLGRAPDAAGLAGWKQVLDTGAQTRTQVVTGFSESGEYINGTRAATDTFVRTTMIAWSDTLVGGAGDDKLTGGRGADRYVFTASDGGNDTIYGFESFDTLELKGFSYVNSAAALAAMSQQGANVVLNYTGGSITFADTQLSVLQGLTAQGWVFG